VVAWLKTHPNKRADLERLSFEAEGLWHIIRLYCAGVGNDGKLPKDELHVAVARKISDAKARRLMAQLVRTGEVLEHADTFEVVKWLDDQPAAAVWDDDTQRERWARNKALRRDRGLCKAIQQRDANLCRYCGTRVNWTDRKGPGGGTYDHVDPDGLNTIDNVVVACRRCNGRKKDRTPEQAGMVLLTAAELRTLLRSASPDPTPVRTESDRRPDSLAHAPEAGPNQNGTGPGLDPAPAGLELEPHADPPPVEEPAA
jgi:5-methylcytosine-specific restriction endonuclease McrA